MAEPKVAQSNIAAIVRMEEEAERDRSLPDRAAETIGRFVGTLQFVVVQVVVAAIWMVANAGPGSLDPFPFPLMGAWFAFEGVTLTAFVLIRQNRMSSRADRRNHLDLQINLLAEQEGTKIIQMLERISGHLGIEENLRDPEAEELAADTPVEAIAADLRQQVEKEEGGDAATERPGSGPGTE